MLRLLIGLLTAVASSVLAALALVLPWGRGLDARLAMGSLAVGAAVGLGAMAHMRRTPVFRQRRVSPWAWLMFAAFGLFALRAFCWLVFRADDEIRVASPNNLGDLSLHMLLARYFANGAAWWPDHPQAAWSTMRYYPGIDLFQSLLMLCGAEEFRALIWVGLIGSAATALALYVWGGSFTVAGFLFSGGLAGFQVFATGRFEDYQADMAWKSLPLAMFITQRGFLYALPVGLLLLAHWRRKFFPPLKSAPDEIAGDDLPEKRGLLPFWVEALLYASMPIFHLFAFFFFSLLLGWWFVVYFHRADLRRHLLLLVGVALVPAAVQCWLMTDGFTGVGTIWREVGWMQKDQPFFSFWLRNFGLFAPLAAGLWLFRTGRLARAVFARQDPVPYEAADAFALPAGLIFLFACVVMLAPWDWDNTKLMIWCYLAALPFLWERCIAPLEAPFRWPLCAALFLSGFVCLIGGIGPEHRSGYPLAKCSEVDAVRSAVRGLPIEGRFAASSEYNHPLVFCGRKLAMGYDGHLFSQGLDYRRLAANLRLLMLGQQGWEKTAARLGVRYLYWGKRENARYAGSTRPWEPRFARVAAGPWGAIYDLSTPAASSASASESTAP
jgi:hypothetical protein